MSITIWKISLNDFQKNIPALWNLLSASEKERVNRFVFEKDKSRFIISRGLLRKIVGSYLNQPAQSLTFQIGPFGKPHPLPISLPPQGGGTRKDKKSDKKLFFNISHSADLVLVAISSDRETGVDVEKIVNKKDLEALVDRFFSSDEISEFKKLPEDQKTRNFFQLWTKKEAFLKAKGVGLSGGLGEQEIKFNQKIQTIHEVANTGDKKVWTIQNLDCGDGYSGAVCVEGEECVFQILSYKNE